MDAKKRKGGDVNGELMINTTWKHTTGEDGSLLEEEGKEQGTAMKDREGIEAEDHLSLVVSLAVVVTRVLMMIKPPQQQMRTMMMIV